MTFWYVAPSIHSLSHVQDGGQPSIKLPSCNVHPEAQADSHLQIASESHPQCEPYPISKIKHGKPLLSWSNVVYITAI